MLYGKKGEIFKCPYCGEAVYRWTRDVNYGDVTEAFQIEGINGYPTPKDGDSALCPKCGKFLFV